MVLVEGKRKGRHWMLKETMNEYQSEITKSTLNILESISGTKENLVLLIRKILSYKFSLRQ